LANWAIVIGIDKYSKPAACLRGAVRDAIAMYKRQFVDMPSARRQGAHLGLDCVDGIHVDDRFLAVAADAEYGGIVARGGKREASGRESDPLPCSWQG
jgi:hypothetical protein